MTNPPYILDHLEQIGKIMNSDKVYKFLHVPIQAGSDSVLNDMKREYTSDDFCRCEYFAKNWKLFRNEKKMFQSKKKYSQIKPT